MKTQTNSYVRFFSLLSIILFAVSCKVGLGGAVDTTAPTITITSPEVSSVLAEGIRVKGTAADDTGLKKVAVNLRGLDDGSSTVKEATVDLATGEWECTFITKRSATEAGHPDGNYEIVATATDIDGKTSTATNAITVDNTPPTVIVNKPALYNQDRTTAFIRTDIVGDAEDANEIKSVKVYLCKYDSIIDTTEIARTATGDEVLPSTVKAFEADGTTTWNFSKELDSADLADFFKHNEEYSFWVVAEDIAGNKNEFFYRKDDFYGILTQTNPNKAPMPPTSAQIGQIVRGKLIGSAEKTAGVTAEKLETIKLPIGNQYQSGKTRNEQDLVSFNFKKESEASVEWQNITEEQNTLPLKTAIIGTIKSTDNSPVIPTSVEFYITARDAEASKAPWKLPIENADTGGKDELRAIGDSVSFTVYPKNEAPANPDDPKIPFKSGNYSIRVEYRTKASEDNPEPLSSSAEFGVSAGTPTLKETAMYTQLNPDDPGKSPTTLEGFFSESITLKGEAVRGDGVPVPTTSNNFKVTLNGNPFTTPNIDQDNGTWSIPVTEPGENRFEFEVNDGEIKVPLYRTVFIDKTDPAITINELQSADGNSVTLAGTLTEDNPNTLEYAFVKKDTNPQPTDWKTPKGVYNWKDTIDTSNKTAFPEGIYTLFVKATDKAKRETIVRQDLVFDRTNPETTENSNLYEKTFKIKKDGNFALSGSATDTLSLDKVVISAKHNNSDSTVWHTETATDNNVTSLSWSKSLDITTENQGNWVFTIEAFDKSGRKSAPKSVIVDVDIEAPVFDTTEGKPAITTAGKDGWYGNQTLTIVGTLTENIDLAKIECSVDNGTTYEEGSYSKNGTTYSYTVKPSFGGEVINSSVLIRATDTAGNSATTTVTGINIELLPPEIEIKSPIGVPLLNGKNDLIIEVKATDAASGVATVKAKINDKDFNTGTTFSGSKIGETDIYIIEISDEEIPKNPTDGYIAILAEDNSGNKTSPVSLNYSIDTTPPTVNIDFLENGSKVNKTITVSGTVSDPDLAQLELFANGTSIYTGNSNLWSKEIATTAYTDLSTLTLKAVATDKAGNKAEKTISVTVDQDSDRPIIHLMDVETTGSFYLNSRHVINGTIQDDDGVEKLEISQDGTNWTEVTLSSSGGSWSYELKPKVAGQTVNGPQTLYFKVKDSAGTTFQTSASDSLLKPYLKDRKNDKTDGVLKFNVDQSNPEIATNEIRFFFEKPTLSSLTDLNNAELFKDNQKIGGDKTSFYLAIKATDANGIASVSVNFDGKTPITATKIENVEGLENIFVTNKIDVSSGIADGVQTLTIKAVDNAGLQYSPTKNIIVDNTAPTVSIISHNENEQIRSNFLLKGNIADDDTGTILKYQTSLSDTPIALSDANWQQIDGATSMSFKLNFDGDYSAADEITHGPLPKNIITTLKNTLKIATEGEFAGKVVQDNGELYKDLVPVYFHFLVIDKLGNYDNSNVLCLRLDPQGDIPTIQMTYPEPALNEQGKKQYEIQSSGIIRASGFAEDDKTIVGLYMQIDPSYDEATGFDENWATTELPGKPGKNLSNVDTSKYKVEDFMSKVENKSNCGKKGIYMGNGLSWNFAINTLEEFNGNNNKIAIRVFAVDVDGNVSIFNNDETMIITIDSDAPRIGSSEKLSLYRYGWKNAVGTVYYTKVPNPKARDSYYASNDPGCSSAAVAKIDSVTTATGNELVKTTSITISGVEYARNFASMEYKDGIWLNGEWFLQGSVEDDNGIKEITVDTKSILDDCIKTTLLNSDNNYYLVHRVGSKTSESAGNLKYNLVAKDTEDKHAEITINVNYDNKKPVLQSKGDDDYSIDETIVNSNGFYLVQSAAEEGSNESGFERAVFFFKRGNTVYDSYIKKETTGNALTVDTDVTIDETGLYWKEKTASTVNGDTITLDSADTNVHKGGIAKFGGTIYRIKDVNSNTLTLDKTPSENLAGQPIFFAIGHVVDHSGTESAGKKNQIISDNSGYGYYNNLPDDDGDLMVEKMQTIGTKTIWNGNINSRNIPDGAIEIHYVVFDKAGNFAQGKVDNAKVENNAPRLAGVTIWTDYNGNGKGWKSTDSDYDSETKSKFESSVRPSIDGIKVSKSKEVTAKLLVTGNDKDNSEATAFMKVTDTVKVIPEIVGGNGKLYYSYDIQNSQNGGKNLTGKGSLLNDSNKQIEGTDDGGENVPMFTDEDSITYVKGHTDGVITFDGVAILSSATGIGNSSNDVPAWFNIKIWDSTEGATVGSGNVNTWNSLNCEMKIALNNQYNDTTKPTAAINPFYWNSEDDNSIVWDTNGKPLGHIELEADLTTAITTLLGNDPKVSGRIKVEGTSEDNIRLKSLTVTFATHSGLNGGQTITYSNGSWSTAESGTDYKFTAQDISSNSDGHKVKWTLEVDTSKITNVAALDKAFTISATDLRGENVSVGSTVQTISGSETPYYKVDVVPYIVEISTGLDKAYTRITSVFNRSSTGAYPVRIGETIKLKGFNFNGANTSVKINNGPEVLNVTAEAGNLSAINVPLVNASASTGDIVVTVNNIQSLNNSNNNPTFDTNNNVVSYSYNAEPNGINNERLNDDRKLYVWTFNRVVTDSGVRYPSMRVGKDANQTVGFVYDSGAQDVKMNINGESFNIDSSWTQFYDTACAIDKNGRIYGHSQCGDSGISDGFITSYSNAYIYAWNTKVVPGTNNSFVNSAYISGTKKAAIECTMNNVDDKFNSTRVRNPKIVAVSNGTNNAEGKIYSVYYDSSTDQIKFRYGRVTNNKGNPQFDTNYSIKDMNYNETEGSANNYQIVAGSTFNNKSPSGTSMALGTTNLEKAGEYSAVGVASDGTAVVVWYDASTQSLLMSYNTNPTANNSANQWGQHTVVIDNDFAGWYVDMIVDPSGAVHIAYYGASGGDLKYAYLPSYNQANNKSVVTVDSYLSVGTNISIDYKTVGSTYIPYISYYMSSFTQTKFSVRTAWLVDINDIADGAIDDVYTGKWEIMTVPTNDIPLDYSVGVGIKGNQPILGYGTKKGLETAQIR